jgi:hypothetical protein
MRGANVERGSVVGGGDAWDADAAGGELINWG